MDGNPRTFFLLLKMTQGSIKSIWIEKNKCVQPKMRKHWSGHKFKQKKKLFEKNDEPKISVFDFELKPVSACTFERNTSGLV